MRQEMNKASSALWEIAKKVVEEINKSIQGNPDDDSVKNKRYFIFNTGDPRFKPYRTLGASPNKSALRFDEEDKKKIWLHRITRSLVEKGHIFKVGNDFTMYFIQA